MRMIEYYKELWKKLPFDVKANLEFAGLVMEQERYNSSYFFGRYSEPLLRYLCVKLFSSYNLEDTVSSIRGEYYDFVAKPYDKNHKPQWYQLKKYEGRNGAKLYTWLSNNSFQYFTKLKAERDEEKKQSSKLLDFVNYEELLSVDDDKPEMTDEQLVRHNRIKKAFEMLNEEDKEVLRILVIEKQNWEYAYERLNKYMRPREGREVMQTWDSERKQNANTALKARAVRHLTKKYNNLIKAMHHENKNN